MIAVFVLKVIGHLRKILALDIKRHPAITIKKELIDLI